MVDIAIVLPFLLHFVETVNLALARSYMQIAPRQIAIDAVARDPLRDQRLGLLGEIEALLSIGLPELRHDLGLPWRKARADLAAIASRSSKSDDLGFEHHGLVSRLGKFERSREARIASAHNANVSLYLAPQPGIGGRC